jgi:chemotaxis protein methyltransferase CheR
MSLGPAADDRANTLGGEDLALLRRLLHERAGIVLDPSRDALLEMRLAALASEAGFATLPEVVGALRSEEGYGDLHRRVVEALAITETSWFRDIHVWNDLRTTVLPDLIQRRQGVRRLQIWSAACASGQEPYSLAMLFEELDASLVGWNVRILATDFSHGILQRARAGAYSQLEVNRGLPARKLVQHFHKAGDEWRLQPGFRERVEFAELNLAVPWPTLPPMDLILMRNVLLYFEPTLRQRVFRRLVQALHPEGLLVLGASETAHTMDDSFEEVRLGRAVVYRRRGRR